MYDTAEEVQQKLVQCLLIYKGSPIFVIACDVADDGAIRIAFFHTSDKNQKTCRVPVSDPGLDIRNCGSRLGYMNVSSYSDKPYNECIYLMRMPRRSSTHSQGLSKSNVYVSGFRGNGTYDLPPTGNLNFDTNIYVDKSSSLQDTFNNIYPDIPSVKKEFSKDITLISRAFNKNWAVRKDEIGLFDLLYKNIRVGWSQDLDTFTIPDRWKFHRSDLSELNINLA